MGTPRVQRLSLSATGTPASGPGSSPAATGASMASAAARASSAVTRLKAWMLGLAGLDDGEVLLERPRRPSARRRGRRRRCRVPRRGRRRRSRLLPRGSGAPGTGRPGDLGRRGEHLVAVESRARRRRRAARCAAGRGGRWADVGEVERLHVGGVVEDGGELAGERSSSSSSRARRASRATCATSSRVMRSGMAADPTCHPRAAHPWRSRAARRPDAGGDSGPVTGAS